MKLSTEIIIRLHERIIETSGGFKGIKDISLIDSAVNSIYQTFDNKELYPTLVEKAARLCYSLNKNHAFIDGNKRISMHALAVFLRIKDVEYAPTNEEVIKVGLSLADGSMSYETLIKWLKKTANI